MDALSTPSIGARPMIVVQDMSTRLPDLSPQGELSDAIRTIPLDRWEVDAIPESNLGGRFGGFVKTWAEFDAAAFGITPSEAALMDPQQRVMLEVRPDFSKSLLTEQYVSHVFKNATKAAGISLSDILHLP